MEIEPPRAISQPVQPPIIEKRPLKENDKSRDFKKTIDSDESKKKRGC